MEIRAPQTKVQENKSGVIYFSSFSTPIGLVFAAKNARGVCRISFPHDTENEFLHAFFEKAATPIERNDVSLQYEIAALRAYFSGKQVTFDFPLDISSGTPFQTKVWKKLQEIPYGECRSYQWVAEQIGSPGASRAVGSANHKNPLPPVIPCHRVIGADGRLTGYASGLTIKKWLLEEEFRVASKALGSFDPRLQ
ncbi:MAG: methylated-DNA--[protein]-cysteine S-methyltransferase [Planctomycetes bacterium]|nr:methylated-DNA--[protein]-cysteine S-methyltransferase [Planctomycetota bacterium]